MAKVRNPLLSLEASGSIGALTFSKTSAGAIAKLKPIPSRSIAGLRPRIRSILGWLSRQWTELTNAQRTAWRQWAADHPKNDKFGDPFIMSGINAYTGLNSHAVRLGLGGAENDLPPEDPPVSAIDELTVVQGALNPGEIDVSFTELGAGIAADFWEWQIAGAFQSEGRVEVGSRFSFVTKTAGNLLQGSLGGLLEGFWYWIRVRYVDAAGQTTAWAYGQATPKLTP